MCGKWSVLASHAEDQRAAVRYCDACDRGTESCTSVYFNTHRRGSDGVGVVPVVSARSNILYVRLDDETQ